MRRRAAAPGAVQTRAGTATRSGRAAAACRCWAIWPPSCRATELGTVSHYDVQPVIDIYANVEGTDLGTVTRGDGEDH